MNIRTGYIHFVLLFVLLFGAWAIGADEPAYEVPLLDGRAFLIRDPAVIDALEPDESQSAQLRQLTDSLDTLLFSLRDAPPRPTDKHASSAIKQVDARLSTLSHILSPVQNKRLLQLWRQYEGINSLFRPDIQRQLKLTTSQSEKIARAYTQSLRQQEAASKDPSTERIQKIQNERIRQTVDILTEPQRKQWFQMMGQPFDFSATRPIDFQAPELRQVSAWVNTPPLTLESLRGKVVVVHFWTFGCVNCIRNYPAYKDWARRFDTEDVVVLGIHTPELKGEKDVSLLQQKVRSEGLNFPIAVDNDKANWDAWFNRVWPGVYLVDKNGRVRFWWYGELNWQGATGDQWILERINLLLRETPDIN